MFVTDEWRLAQDRFRARLAAINKAIFNYNLKVPSTLTQGDRPRFMAQVHHRGVTGRVDLPGHHTNFLQAIKGEAKPNAPVEAGHVAAGICHLANISTRLRRTIEFDPVKEAVTNSPDANAMLRRKYRPNHWAVPKNV